MQQLVKYAKELKIKKKFEKVLTPTGVDFGEARGRNMFGPLGFLSSNTHLATRNPKFRTEIEPECGEDLFFGLHLNLDPKFRNSGLK